MEFDYNDKIVCYSNYGDDWSYDGITGEQLKRVSETLWQNVKLAIEKKKFEG